jgi:hypothetical protein
LLRKIQIDYRALYEQIKWLKSIYLRADSNIVAKVIPTAKNTKNPANNGDKVFFSFSSSSLLLSFFYINLTYEGCFNISSFVDILLVNRILFLDCCLVGHYEKSKTKNEIVNFNKFTFYSCTK